MPAKKIVDEAPEDAAVEPNAAQAAAAEAGVVEPQPDVPDGMIAVPFRGRSLIVPSPAKSARSFKVRMAIASNDGARLLASLIGENGTMQIAALIDEDADDFDAVVTEFFEAYGKATGQGNS